MGMDKCLWLAGGALLGSYGVKILKTKEAKKVGTHIAAVVLRAKDEVEKDITALSESCSDIIADAKLINEQKAAENEIRLIEDAKRVLAEAEEKVKAAEAAETAAAEA